MNTYTLEALGPEDIPALVDLSAAIGWDYDAREIGTLEAVGRLFGHKTRDRHLVSSAAIVPYSHAFAFLGMVMVHPDHRQRGLGTMVTQAALAVQPPGHPVALVSTPSGQGLYQKIGFQQISTVHKYVRSSSKVHDDLTIRPPESPLGLKRMEEHDLPAITALDAAAFGVRRQEFLRHRWLQSATAWILTDGIYVRGYAFGIEGPANWILGPVVAPTDAAATQLVAKVAVMTSNPMRIDVPDEHAEWAIKTLPPLGFKKVAQPPLMTYQGALLPPRRGLYALAAQVFG
ncbi:GCN5-related N-acetyltransferase [Sulfobacillus acidophilus DSM 10332]|uniref:GCN5-related N-acetyltransferase n=1 Tax=Sulfobacillus acidophilus (strain ATCC 700253 / DSM 10332 / NAL) TaxID=679936 RepID=G8TS44_SULAD|nr:GCN5-related N-acetyltransferase [Sulfobacillus acidophilus DSM 10332]